MLQKTKPVLKHIPLLSFRFFRSVFLKFILSLSVNNYCMRSLFFLSVFCCFLTTSAQTVPLSFRYFEKTPEIRAKYIVAQEEIYHLEKTVLEGKNATFPVIAHTVATDIDLLKQSEKREINANSVYLFSLKASSAKGLIAYFDDFKLSKGSILHLYSPDRTQTFYYTAENTQSGFFTADIVQGEELIFEYTAGENAQNDRLHISETGYVFNLLPKPESSSREFGDAGSCEVNVNCDEEGSDFQLEKQAVVRILVKAGNSVGWCSGSLLNNTANDCTPYLLTADHCQINSSGEYSSELNFNQWRFYFNYETPTCANISDEGTLASQMLTGATRIAYSNDNGGDNGSDFLLVKLKSRPDTLFDVYYAGWDASADIPQFGVSIHHPSADVKKISTYHNPAVSSSYSGTTPGSHWRVFWGQTANGHGVTEGGSSGGALFSEYGLVVGTLTGGAASCLNKNGADEFGKFSYHWTKNGTAANRQLKPWLDPQNTGAEYIGGISNCQIPSAVRDIKAKAAVNVSVVPNPTQGVFRIESNFPVQETAVYDISGRLLNIFSDTETISLHGFPKGIYIAKITTSQGTALRKVVLE